MQQEIDALRRDGIVQLPAIGPGPVYDIWTHLTKCEVKNAHVEAKATSEPVRLRSALAAGQWPMMCHAMRDVILAPHLFEAALELRELAQDYFDGERPLLYSMNVIWTQPAPGVPQYQDTHSWHRDGDDRKQLVMFMFGTDVGIDGAHLYQKGSHRIADSDLGRDFRDPAPESIEAIYGPAGSVFLADTGGLHIGLRPRKHRMLAWARWGVSDPPESYRWDQLAPIPRALLGERYPSDPVLQEAVHLIVD